MFIYPMALLIGKRIDISYEMRNMKYTLALALIAFCTSSAIAQDSGITVEEYPIKTELTQSEFEKLENPIASTTCEDKTLTWLAIDKEFSGGKSGVIERTWLAEDKCGNSTKTLQYIVLID